jgi:hypothetical protein
LKTQQRFSVFGLSWNTAKICCGGFLNNDAPSLSTQQPSMISVPKRNELGREKFWEGDDTAEPKLIGKSAGRQMGKSQRIAIGKWRLATGE